MQGNAQRSKYIIWNKAIMTMLGPLNQCNSKIARFCFVFYFSNAAILRELQQQSITAPRLLYINKGAGENRNKTHSGDELHSRFFHVSVLEHILDVPKSKN